VRDRRPDEEDVAGAAQPVVHDILGVDAAGGQEARILDPQDPGTQDAHDNRSPRIGPPAIQA